MKWIFIIPIVCLLIAFTTVLLRLIHVKREICSFSNEVEKLKNSDYAQPLKVNCFDRNVTELAVKINEYVDKQQKIFAANESEKAKLNNVISGISHDFRTPLTASLGYLQLIEKSGELSGKKEEYLTIAIKKNKYLMELSDEFFELSKLGNENEEIAIEEINISNLISEMIMEQYGWIGEKGIIPHFDITDGIVIKSNAKYLKRIIQNLMSNAEKYAVHKFSVKLFEINGKICVDICNDVDEYIQSDKVFEPFYKGNARNKEGTGLGLYVVKCLSEKLGYSVLANVNENSEFGIELFI